MGCGKPVWMYLRYPEVFGRKPAMAADFCLWNIANPAEHSYRIGFNPLEAAVIAGNRRGLKGS